MATLQTDWQLTAPLYYRQAVADQNSAPQANEENTEHFATMKFLDMKNPDFNEYQKHFYPPDYQQSVLDIQPE